jgi:hypothetical protein
VRPWAGHALDEIEDPQSMDIRNASNGGRIAQDAAWFGEMIPSRYKVCGYGRPSGTQTDVLLADKWRPVIINDRKSGSVEVSLSNNFRLRGHGM